MKTPDGGIIEERNSRGIMADAQRLISKANHLPGGQIDPKLLIRREIAPDREDELAALHNAIDEIQRRTTSTTRVATAVEPAVQDAADLTGTDADTTTENLIKTITVREANKLLKPLGIDLELSLGQFSESKIAFGFMQALQRKGIGIRTPDQFAALIFDQAHPTEDGIRNLIELLKQGQQQIPVFYPGSMTPGDSMDAVSGIVSICKDPYFFEKRHDIRVIKPADFQDLGNLHTLSRQEQLSAFAEAYRNASAFITSGPRILFTSDDTEAVQDGDTTTSRIKESVRYMPLEADIIRYSMQKVQGKKPERNGWSQSPNYVFPNGNVATLGSIHGGLCILGFNPDDKLGARTILE